YNSALQLSLVGESLMGWFVWDLMRGIDVLLKQQNIDPSRIVLLGAVAGGGDPAGVTAALDPRVACLVPFNFGGWQPESGVPENPDRDFAWFGEGYWETTRGLRNGARDGFAHYVIVGSMAPRPVVYAHEFKWDAAADPAWPRLQKIYGFYDAKDRLAVAHGAGSVRGEAGPDNTHCTHIGAPHRSMIYPALKAWFDIPIPEEYSKRRPAEELRCWTDAARAELQPRMLHEVLTEQSLRARERAGMELAGLPVTQLRTRLRERWAALLGPVEPVTDPKVTAEREVSARGMGLLTQYVLEVEPGGYVPVVLLKPVGVKGTLPVVVMVAQTGNQPALVVERADVWAALLRAGVAVCLVDVRGTGESRPGGGSPDRGRARTSVAQTNLILGTPAAGMQLRDLRTVLRWVRARDDVDGTRVAVWGDSLSPVNPPGRDLAAPLDAPDLPAIAEPGGALLAELAELYEDGLAAVVARGGLTDYHSVLTSPYPYVPFDAVVPGVVGPRSADLPTLRRAATVPIRREGWVDGQNRRVGDDPPPATETVRWLVERLNRK
ncbi:MAG: CocE/NonD family hydrolase, partial [Gemmataceae bacterium]|nr:CocE/NonD family hydrolase [Gemmataceae bacterium]